MIESSRLFLNKKWKDKRYLLTNNFLKEKEKNNEEEKEN